MTGPILVVGGRHRKGSAIPAVPHLAQLQSPIYQWVLTGLPGSTLGTWRFCERDRPLPLSPFSFTGDRGFESRFLRQRVGNELLSAVMSLPREFHRREATPLATSCSICDETAGEGGRASGLSCPRLDLPQHRSNGEGYQIMVTHNVHRSQAADRGSVFRCGRAEGSRDIHVRISYWDR